MQVGRKLSLNFEIIKITKGNENEFLISILDRGFSRRDLNISRINIMQEWIPCGGEKAKGNLNFITHDGVWYPAADDSHKISGKLIKMIREL